MINKKGGRSSYYIIRGDYDYIIYQYIHYNETIFSVFPPPDEILIKEFKVLSSYDCIALFKVKNKSK